METQIIPKQNNIPPFDSHAIKILRIEYFGPSYKTYYQDQITEKIIAQLLKKISDGTNVYLYLDLDGEDDWLEVNCDGQWIALGFWGDSGKNNYFSYNPAFADSAEQILTANFSDKRFFTDLLSGGQSPIPKIQAIPDIQSGLNAVEYFIRTGLFFPGIDWLHESQ